MKPKKTKFSLRRYLSWSLGVAVVLLFGGLALIWRTAGDASTEGVVGREVGAVLMTTAFLIGIYETLLREQLIKDVGKALDLKTDITAVGLAHVAIGPLDWHEYFANKSRIILLPEDPSSWLKSGIWAAILARAREAQIEVSLYLPNWNNPTTLSALAHQLNRPDTVALKTELENIYVSVVSTWQSRASQSLASGCRLTPRVYSGLTGTGLVLGDRSAIVTIPGSYSGAPGEMPFTLTFQLDTSSKTEHWLNSLLDGLNARAANPIVAP